MKKVLKVLSLVLVLAIALVPTLSFAVPSLNTSGELPTEIDGVSGIVGTIISILTWVGYAIAIVMVLWLGVQWMLATPSKKAELKGRMWSMAIGILLLVGGVTIVNLVWNTAEGLSNAAH